MDCRKLEERMVSFPRKHLGATKFLLGLFFLGPGATLIGTVV